MLNEIEQLINLLETEGHLKPEMTKPEVIRLVYGLMMANGRRQVTELLATWQRCSFLRRHLAGMLSADNCHPETFDLIKKGPLVTQMARHFQISESHTYTVCNTCIALFKSEKRIK